MAGQEHEMAAEGDRSHLRASHGDRERVIGTVTAAYVYGLVTKDEFDARVSQTLAARTYADLAMITDDIPAGLAPAPPPLRPAPAKASPPAQAKLGPRERAVVGTALLAGVLLVAAVAAGNLAGGFLALGATGAALVSMVLAAAHVLSSRRGRRSGGQRLPRRSVHSGPGADRRVGSAGAAGQLPRSSEPGRPGSADAAGRHSLRPQVSS